MHSYVLGEKWDIKVYGEGMIGGVGSSVMTVEIIFGKHSYNFLKGGIITEPTPPIIPSP